MPFFKFQISKFSTRVQAEGFRSQIGKKILGTDFTFKISKRPHNKGFTLVELLVVIALISILAAFVFASYQNFGQRQEVQNVALELKSSLRKYQNFAISGQKNPDPTNVSQCHDPSSLANDSTYSVVYYAVLADSSPVPHSYKAVLHCAHLALGYDVEFVNGFPWENLENFEVGKASIPPSSDDSCDSVEIRFKPVNKGIELYCDSSPLAAPYDQVYFSLSNGAATYRVYVTSSGDIYEEQKM